LPRLGTTVHTDPQALHHFLAKAESGLTLVANSVTPFSRHLSSRENRPGLAQRSKRKVSCESNSPPVSILSSRGVHRLSDHRASRSVGVEDPIGAVHHRRAAVERCRRSESAPCPCVRRASADVTSDRRCWGTTGGKMGAHAGFITACSPMSAVVHERYNGGVSRRSLRRSSSGGTATPRQTHLSVHPSRGGKWSYVRSRTVQSRRRSRQALPRIVQPSGRVLKHLRSLRMRVTGSSMESDMQIFDTPHGLQPDGFSGYVCGNPLR
jgi:hypothetical protein